MESHMEDDIEARRAEAVEDLDLYMMEQMKSQKDMQ